MSTRYSLYLCSSHSLIICVAFSLTMIRSV
uniref:Uncharacterized protein n=1 Tax=Arundo donax TaxID=35708 RepID=A0A0A9F925_ARUDO